MSPLKIHTFGKGGLEFETGAVYTPLNNEGVILTEGRATFYDCTMVAVRGKAGGTFTELGDTITVYPGDEYDLVSTRGYYVLGLDVVRPRRRGRRG
jgi:hypothetical protein